MFTRTNSPTARSNKPERDFAFLIAAILLCISSYKYYNQAWTHTQFFACILSVIGVIAVAILKPELLQFPLSMWIKLGDFMGKIVSPLVLGIIFFCMITPIAVVVRLIGRDLLRLKKTKASTCWVERDKNVQPSNSFKTQF